ncbi:MAG: twin-arginine translocase TatA/TatE family subunit [Candidatus Eisenbacteria bacterium]|uniref:Sec-independent protein translocase protein TatA n=1 Tax=Eiseniibacteriota bacterium TaxID=2212470 RepID=A0A956N9C5_UNCEI|nr:twin-arginine translocase TatA/TatE family subunit [Candidatus Eisenbacteria bacterium]MCB9463053.1 twin-arginine translocase TatA/TatE family subunit [Candidatus Eisenbacteria bacterium]
MGAVGIREILVIALIIVILFGAKRIPELMKGMGQGIKEFKSGMREDLPDHTDDEKKTSV